MEPIIKVDNVSMCFNLSKEKHESLKEYFLAMVQGRLQYDEFYALKDVSLDIMPGDFYGLVGLNGSGKSTLLKTIAGVYKPSKGKVTVNGTIAPLIELGAGFDMDLTARENIYLNGTVLGFSPKYLDEKFDEIVEFSELQNFLDVPLKNYSSGMVARIGFAYWPGFCSTPSDHSLVSLSCTGTKANASVAIISQPMPRTGASSSSAEMSGLSSALAVMAQRMSTGM